MKINDKFVLRQVADMWVVLTLADETVDFGGMITLNESGVQLWRALEQGADEDSLVQALLAEYDVSEQQARTDVQAFLEKLHAAGCIDEV